MSVLLSNDARAVLAAKVGEAQAKYQTLLARRHAPKTNDKHGLIELLPVLEISLDDFDADGLAIDERLRLQSQLKTPEQIAARNQEIQAELSNARADFRKLAMDILASLSDNEIPVAVGILMPVRGDITAISEFQARQQELSARAQHFANEEGKPEAEQRAIQKEIAAIERAHPRIAEQKQAEARAA